MNFGTGNPKKRHVAFRIMPHLPHRGIPVPCAAILPTPRTAASPKAKTNRPTSGAEHDAGHADATAQRPGGGRARGWDGPEAAGRGGDGDGCVNGAYSPRGEIGAAAAVTAAAEAAAAAVGLPSQAIRALGVASQSGGGTDIQQDSAVPKASGGSRPHPLDASDVAVNSETGDSAAACPRPSIR